MLAKEDCQTSGSPLSNKVDLAESFKYLISTIPLSIATTNMKLWQVNNKCILITECGSVSCSIPENEY